MDRPRPDGNNSTATDSWCYDGRQTGYGGRCPEGHYCVEGSDFPVPCEAGSYAASMEQRICDPCVAGEKPLCSECSILVSPLNRF